MDQGGRPHRPPLSDRHPDGPQSRARRRPSHPPQGGALSFPNRIVGLLTNERRKAHISQLELGRRVDMLQCTIAQMESGRRRPLTLPEFVAFCEALKLDPVATFIRLMLLP